MVASSKELVLSVLEGSGRERTPVFAPFSAYLSCKLHGVTTAKIISNPVLAARAQMDVGQQCGFDGLETVVDFLSPAEACGSKVKIPDYGLIPVVSPAIRELGDLDRLTVPEPREDRRFASSMVMAEAMDRELGRSHFLYPTLCGPFTLLGELRGLEKLFFDLVIEPGAVREMLRFAAEVLSGYQEEIITLSPDAVAVPDPTSSGSFLSEENFRKFVLPTNTAFINRLKNKGQRVLWHICGDSFDNFQAMSSVEVDMLSVDAPVSLSRISDAFPDATMIGNLPPEGALTGGPPIEVVKQSVDRMKEMAGRKYILAAGCGLTLDCEIEDIRMMRFSSEQYSLVDR
jgi:uroporphyrinogen decarboxylase